MEGNLNEAVIKYMNAENFQSEYKKKK